MATTSKEKKTKTSTILPLYVKTRNQLVKKEVADAEPLELHLDPLQGDEKDEARGVVELRGGKGAGLRATQRQNDLDSRLLNTSKLIKVTLQIIITIIANVINIKQR